MEVVWIVCLVVAEVGWKLLALLVEALMVLGSVPGRDWSQETMILQAHPRFGLPLCHCPLVLLHHQAVLGPRWSAVNN